MILETNDFLANCDIIKKAMESEQAYFVSYRGSLQKLIGSLSENFKGETGTSLTAYCNDVLNPFVDCINTQAKNLQTVTSKISEETQSIFGEQAIVSTDYIQGDFQSTSKREIDRLLEIDDEANQTCRQVSDLVSCPPIDYSSLESTKSDIKTQSDDVCTLLVEKDQAWQSELEHINDKLTQLSATALEIGNIDCLTYTAGDFVFPIGLSYSKYQEDFIEQHKKQHGFDDDTVKLLWKVWEGVVAKNPNATQKELDYMYTRAVSQLVYNKGGDLTSQWRAGAGYVYGYSEKEEKEYFMNLGLTEDEYNKLRYKVRVQNNIVSNPERFGLDAFDDMIESKNKKGRLTEKEENLVKDYNSWKKHMEKGLGRKLTNSEFEKLWKEQFNSFCTKTDGKYRGKTDFAHMMYTISGSLVDENAKGIDKSFPDWYALPLVGWRKFWTDSETRKQYVGWLGDATWAGKEGKKVGFGPEDYTSDLDADNIRKRMENGKSYMQASQEYYQEMEKTPKLRVKEFNKNNKYEDVEKEVLKRAGVKSLDALKEKKGWEDTYDFLMSLKNENEVMSDY